MSKKSIILGNIISPNGALGYCMDFLEHNSDWLFSKLDSVDKNASSKTFYIFDLPGELSRPN